MKAPIAPSGFFPCSHILGFLWAYVAGELEEGERREFERHLAVCPACVAYLATYRQTIALTREAAREPAEEPEAPPAELVEAILRSQRIRAGER